MSRCIDADALEKEGWSLHRTIRVDKNTEEYQTKPIRQVPTIEPRCETCEAFNKTRLLIPQPQRIGRWIPCKERLPDRDDEYFVTVDPRYIPPGCRSTDKFIWHDGKWVIADYFVMDGDGYKKPEYKIIEVDIPVLAWMPLPEPYREGE